jgi:hypothetical protein
MEQAAPSTTGSRIGSLTASGRAAVDRATVVDRVVGSCAGETALSLPSVPLSVDFSTWLAEADRR